MTLSWSPSPVWTGPWVRPIAVRTPGGVSWSAAVMTPRATNRFGGVVLVAGARVHRAVRSADHRSDRACARWLLRRTAGVVPGVGPKPRLQEFAGQERDAQESDASIGLHLHIDACEVALVEIGVAGRDRILERARRDDGCDVGLRSGTLENALKRRLIE